MNELKIMRFIERGDFERRADLPEFHAFVWNHSSLSPTDARTMRNERNALSLPYFCVLDRGLDDWTSPWFDWLKANTAQLHPPDPTALAASVPMIQLHDRRPDPTIVNAVASFPHAVTWYARDFIDWPHMTFAAVTDMVVTMRNNFGGDGLYFDQYWRNVYDWMFSVAGAPYSAFPPHWWGAWRYAMDYLVQFAGMVTSGKVWTNGDHSAGCAKIYEHAEYDYEKYVAEWRADYDTMGSQPAYESVLTVDPNGSPWAVDRAIADWASFGKGWLGFTTMVGATTAVDDAYARAAVASTE